MSLRGKARRSATVWRRSGDTGDVDRHNKPIEKWWPVYYNVPIWTSQATFEEAEGRQPREEGTLDVVIPARLDIRNEDRLEMQDATVIHLKTVHPPGLKNRHVVATGMEIRT